MKPQARGITQTQMEASPGLGPNHTHCAVKSISAFSFNCVYKAIWSLYPDIVSGDIRSIMRLILALAARYKPNTVRQTSRHANQKTSSRMSVVGYAQVSEVSYFYF